MAATKDKLTPEEIAEIKSKKYKIIKSYKIL